MIYICPQRVIPLGKMGKFKHAQSVNTFQDERNDIHMALDQETVKLYDNSLIITE